MCWKFKQFSKKIAKFFASAGELVLLKIRSMQLERCRTNATYAQQHEFWMFLFLFPGLLFLTSFSWLAWLGSVISLNLYVPTSLHRSRATKSKPTLKLTRKSISHLSFFVVKIPIAYKRVQFSHVFQYFIFSTLFPEIQ